MRANHPRLRMVVTAALVLFTMTMAGRTTFGQLTPEQVLVIYNSQNADSLAVWDTYRAARPGVLGVDLNDPTLTGGTISYADYRTKIRDRVQQYLMQNDLASQIAVLTPTKGIPHRIKDIALGNVGDTPSAVGSLLVAGNATYASVDSELTLLWQNLSDGEAAGLMDSHADNVVLNPYHAQGASINAFDRSTITEARTFTNYTNDNLLWTMQHNGQAADAGVMYLTSRLDGQTVADVQAMIGRASNVVLDPYHHEVVLDENGGGSLDNMALFTHAAHDPAYSGDDYDDTAALLAGRWTNVTFDQGNAFVIGPSGTFVPDPDAAVTDATVALLATYGGNHSSVSQSGYLNTWQGHIAAGAVMNTLESYNARNFGGVGGWSDQGQLAAWIAAGGTFGVGNVWEPLAFSVADNEYLATNFLLGGMTWAEAAWTSIPYLSWQQLVVGDPLAVVRLLSGDADGDLDVDGADFLLWQSHFGTPTGATLADGDFDADGDVDGADYMIWQRFYGANFNAQTPGGETGETHWIDLPTVPEPATASIVAVSLLLGLRRRRKRII